jgi:hypothetical protein
MERGSNNGNPEWANCTAMHRLFASLPVPIFSSTMTTTMSCLSRGYSLRDDGASSFLGNGAEGGGGGGGGGNARRGGIGGRRGGDNVRTRFVGLLCVLIHDRDDILVLVVMHWCR